MDTRKLLSEVEKMEIIKRCLTSGEIKSRWCKENNIVNKVDLTGNKSILSKLKKWCSEKGNWKYFAGALVTFIFKGFNKFMEKPVEKTYKALCKIFTKIKSSGLSKFKSIMKSVIKSCKNGFSLL